LDGRKFIGRKATLVVSAVAALGVAGVLGAIPASATTGTVGVLYFNGTSTAVLNADGSATLTAGATPNTDSAQIDIVNPPSAAPTTAPTFSVTPASVGGDPRWVLEFHNGNILTDNGDGNWTCSASGATGNTYADALAVCAPAAGSDSTVTAAFIVTDAGEPGTAFTVSAVTYDGPVTLEATTTPTSSSSTGTSGSSSSSTTPKGGVQTGGGKPVNSPLLPFGLGLAVFGLLALAGGAVALRRQRG
jgi:hypothetical protein